jgi:hypothetical protein
MLLAMEECGEEGDADVDVYRRTRGAMVQAAAPEAARPFHPRRRRAQLRPDQLRPEL